MSATRRTFGASWHTATAGHRSRLLRVTGCIAAGVLLSTACGSQASPHRPTGVIRGAIYELGGPTINGQSACRATRCSSAGTIRITSKNAAVLTVKAAAANGFTVDLPAGRYRLSAGPGCEDRFVAAVAGRTVRTKIFCNIK